MMMNVGPRERDLLTAQVMEASEAPAATTSATEEPEGGQRVSEDAHND